jgi:hypothetical protein
MRPADLALSHLGELQRGLVARVARRGAVAQAELGGLRLSGAGEQRGGGQKRQRCEVGLALHVSCLLVVEWGAIVPDQ